MITSAQEFVMLVESEDPHDQYRARHEDASEEVWFEVLEKYPEYSRSVVLNKKIPLGILHFLAQSPDPQIRWDVALKRKLDDDLFETLSQDPDDSVRVRIALNPKVPEHILERLALDSEAWVAEEARQRLENFRQKKS